MRACLGGSCDEQVRRWDKHVWDTGDSDSDRSSVASRAKNELAGHGQRADAGYEVRRMGRHSVWRTWGEWIRGMARSERVGKVSE